jgi:hypothetical protein|tara:strand:+ start:624 stop:914 length:291 start_codon:yes stop_codon:yes gene_type:complete
MLIYFILLLSISLNVLLAWYARKIQTEYILFIRDNLEALSQMHNEFNEHLEVVNNMEMYFGDQTLVELLKHSKFVKEQTAEFLLVLQGLDEEAEEE